MAANSIFDTIMGLATVLGSSLGLVMGGILVVALLLRALEGTQSLVRHDEKTAH